MNSELREMKFGLREMNSELHEMKFWIALNEFRIA